MQFLFYWAKFIPFRSLFEVLLDCVKTERKPGSGRYKTKYSFENWVNLVQSWSHGQVQPFRALWVPRKWTQQSTLISHLLVHHLLVVSSIYLFVEWHWLRFLIHTAHVLCTQILLFNNLLCPCELWRMSITWHLPIHHLHIRPGLPLPSCQCVPTSINCVVGVIFEEQTTEGWNTPKYSLERYLSHEVRASINEQLS